LREGSAARPSPCERAHSVGLRSGCCRFRTTPGSPARSLPARSLTLWATPSGSRPMAIWWRGRWSPPMARGGPESGGRRRQMQRQSPPRPRSRRMRYRLWQRGVQPGAGYWRCRPMPPTGPRAVGSVQLMPPGTRGRSPGRNGCPRTPPVPCGRPPRSSPTCKNEPRSSSRSYRRRPRSDLLKRSLRPPIRRGTRCRQTAHGAE